MRTKKWLFPVSLGILIVLFVTGLGIVYLKQWEAVHGENMLEQVSLSLPGWDQVTGYLRAQFQALLEWVKNL